MDYIILQENFIRVLKNDAEYLFVKWKGYFSVTSEFYLGGELVLKSKIWRNSIEILFQKLPHYISVIGQRFRFELDYAGHSCQLKNNLFKRPMVVLSLDGIQTGSVSKTRFFSFGSAEYILSSDIEDETANLYFVLLFIMKIPTID